MDNCIKLNVSIVIPCYNCDKYIIETLKSLEKQIYTKFELIIIDDCSTDNTLLTLIKYQKCHPNINIRIYKNETNLGVALTRNRGVSLAKSEYIAFLDADDTWDEKKLEIQMEFMNNRPFIDMSYTAYNLYDETLKSLISVYNVPKKAIYNNMLYENIIGLSTVIIKKSVFEKYQMSNKYIHEDYELWLKLLKTNHKIRGINRPLVNYRVFEKSKNSNKFKSFIGRIKILHIEEKISIYMLIKTSVVYLIKGMKKYKKH